MLKLEKLDPRERRTRQALQTAFEELIRTRPFNKITVEGITTQAGINRATFYAHFDDKYALLNYVIQAQFQAVLDAQLPEHPVFTEENLALLVQGTCEFLGRFVDHCLPVERQEKSLMLEIPVQNRLQAVLTDWLQPVSHDSALETIAAVLSWSIMGIARQWAYGERQLSAKAMTDQTLPLIVKGIQPYLA